LLLEDKVKRAKFGEKGRQFVLKQFSVEALVERHEAFYAKALLKLAGSDAGRGGHAGDGM
jgi:hypothetical protein